MTIDELRQSISTMSDGELQELILSIRKNRRTEIARVGGRKKGQVKKDKNIDLTNLIASLPQDVISQLVEKLSGMK